MMPYTLVVAGVLLKLLHEPLGSFKAQNLPCNALPATAMLSRKGYAQQGTLVRFEASACSHQGLPAVCCLQQHLPGPAQAMFGRMVRVLVPGRLFTAEELRQYTSDNPAGGGKVYMAILGEVFDVTSKPEFYGEAA